MTLFTQILLGSILLGVCSIFHIALIAGAVRLLKGIRQHFHNGLATHWIVLSAVGLGTVVLAHTIQVWIWAIAFIALGALPDISDAIYFSLATYTTLGYGDVTVTGEHRVFASMEAVTGLLSFGLSTAFLVALVTRLLRKL